MKSLKSLILVALLSSSSVLSAKTNDEKEQEAKTSKKITLEVKGLISDYKSGWYIPNQHIVYLQLEPNAAGKLVVTNLETKNHRLAKSMLPYFYQKTLDVTSTQPVRVRVILSD